MSTLAVLGGLAAAPSIAGANTYEVSSTGDSGVGSLRQAIDDANANAGADVIDFVGGSEGTITLASALPSITGPVTIDSGLTATVDGSSLSSGESGFQVAASDVAIANMPIQGFPGNGIEVSSGANAALENNVITSNGGNGIALDAGTTGATVLGNKIGVDETGTASLPNAGSGILVSGTGHQIGATTSVNVVSGNGAWGIDVASGSTGSKHLIRHNYIGTDAAGTTAIPNATGGVLVEATAPGTTVGGTAANQGNVLSGNGGPGVQVAANSTVVAGNMVGIDPTGVSAVANGGSGVEVQGTPTGVVIGGTTAAAANLISGNGVHGVSLTATGTQVLGNKIGTDAAGTTALPNTQDGVYVAGANNRIGVSSTGTLAANLISGNSGYGIEADTGANGTLVQGNRIGTDASGTAALANGVAPTGAGILAREAVTIGGAGVGAGNLISGNDGPGVDLEASDPGQSSTVYGNTIGLNLAGGGAIANNGDGVLIAAGTDAAIGGASAGQGNLISGNTGSGVASEGTGVQISGNRIGVATDGTTPLANGADGIALGAAAQTHVIGGSTAAAGNLIANQPGSGISDLSAAAGNEIRVNSVYANGVLPIDELANGSLDANDAGDAAPPQNSPQITSALTNGSRVTVRGVLHSAASKSYVVRLFAAAGPAATGSDIRTYLGATTVQTNASGVANFNVTLAQPLTANRYVTATATSPQKNTSEVGAGVVSATAGTVQVAPVTYAVLESARKATITIRRSGSTAQPAAVHYATVAGTAHAGSDFTPKSGTAMIAAGAASTNVVIPVVDDSQAEPVESFTVKIDSPTGAVLGTADTGTVTITDDAFGTATRVSLLVANPFKATKAGVVQVGVRNSNPFAVTGTLRVLKGAQGIGSAALSVPAGTTKQVMVQLSSAAVAELKQKGQLKATLSAQVRDGDGHLRTVSRQVTIVRG